MATVTVSAKGWVVIPAAYRRKYRVNPGSRMEIVDYGGGMSLVPALGNPILFTGHCPATVPPDSHGSATPRPAAVQEMG